jgi:short-subunit dehydrogenase
MNRPARCLPSPHLHLRSSAEPRPKTSPGRTSTEVANPNTLHEKYKNADWAQTKSKRSAEAALELLKAEAEEMLIPHSAASARTKSNSAFQ